MIGILFLLFPFLFLFFLSRFSFTNTDKSQESRGRDHLLFHSTTYTCSRTFRHIFATLCVRWISHIFNRTACIYQTTTWLDLPPYWITIFDWCDVKFCMFTWWFDSRFLLQQFEMWNWWTWTRINYHPCITGELTNQVCLSLKVFDLDSAITSQPIGVSLRGIPSDKHCFMLTLRMANIRVWVIGKLPLLIKLIV